jgi:hypothetical protein
MLLLSFKATDCPLWGDVLLEFAEYPRALSAIRDSVPRDILLEQDPLFLRLPRVEDCYNSGRDSVTWYLMHKSYSLTSVVWEAAKQPGNSYFNSPVQ